MRIGIGVEDGRCIYGRLMGLIVMIPMALEVIRIAVLSAVVFSASEQISICNLTV